MNTSICDNEVYFSRRGEGFCFLEKTGLVIPVRSIAIHEFYSWRRLASCQFQWNEVTRSESLSIPFELFLKLDSSIRVHIANHHKCSEFDISVDTWDFWGHLLSSYPASMRARTYASPSPFAPERISFHNQVRMNGANTYHQWQWPSSLSCCWHSRPRRSWRAKYTSD